MVESVGAGNDFEERVNRNLGTGMMLGSFRVHLSLEPSQKKTHLFPTEGGVGLANGRAGTEHPGF